MQTSAMRDSLGRFCEWMAIALATLAIASGFLLGSGKSATAQSVFVALGAAALLWSVLSMLVAGTFRLVRSPLWLCGAAMVALGAFQILPHGASYLPKSDFWLNQANSSASASISLNRAATLQTLLWMGGAMAILFVLSAHVRTTRRLCGVTAALSITLGLSGFVGSLQTIAGREAMLGGIVSLDQAPVFLQQAFTAGRDSWIWSAVASTAEGMMFLPEPPRHKFFGGMLSPAHFAACVAVGLPLVLAMVVYLAGFAGSGGWRTHAESKFAHLLWTLGLCLAGTAAWFGDPILVPGLLLLLLAVTSILIGRGERRRGVPRFLLAAVVVAAVAGVWIVTHGLPNLRVRYDTWLADVTALAQWIRDNPWLGCGLGTGGDVASLYRVDAGSPSEVSSLAILIGEIGFVGASILGVGFLFAVVNFLWNYTSLDRDSKIVLAGSATGLIGLGVLAAYGNSIAPAAMAAALLPAAAFLRSIAGGFRDEEALFSQ